MPNRPAAPRNPKALRALRDHPALPQIIPSLPPRVLTRLFDVVGMNDAGSLMAMAPAPLLARAFDEAVWTSDGRRTRFDPDVFVDWLEVWLGEGDEFAAGQLLAMDEDMLALCFGAVLQVRDSAVDGFHRWAYDDGEVTEAGDEAAGPGPFATLIDRFAVSAVQEDEWDVLHPALMALWAAAPDGLLALLERLTVDDSRLDGEESEPRLGRDAVGARESRQERAGYVPPAAARAFLALATVTPAHELSTMTDYDLETARHLKRLGEERSPGPEVESPGAGRVGRGTAAHPDPAPVLPEEHDNLWTLLAAAGVVDPSSPAGLLSGPASAPESALRRRLDELADADPQALGHAASELAYLANVLLGAGFPGSGRDAEEDARTLAFATASLGLELLERHGVVVLGTPPGLVRTFLVAWRALSELPMSVVRAFERAFAAPDMSRHLASRRWLRPQMEESLGDLRNAVTARRLEDAREAVSLLSLAFQTDACRAAAHLLGEPPRFPALLEQGDKDHARWIQSIGDLTRVMALLEALGPKA